MLKITLTAALLLTLTACTLQPRIEPQPVSDWEQFEERQQQLTQWHLAGKLGFKSPQESGSAALDWQQDRRQFEVHLSGALGFGATRISGTPDQVVMSRGDNQQRATSSEDLTRQLLGVPLPVEALTYWVRGIPTPVTPVAAQTHNESGTLATLSQAGWELEFSRYAQSGGWLLPGKIVGQRGDVSFKLIIKNWQPKAADVQ